MWNALGRIPAEGQITDEKRFAVKARHRMEENSERIELCVVLPEELEQIFASSHRMWGGGGLVWALLTDCLTAVPCRLAVTSNPGFLIFGHDFRSVVYRLASRRPDDNCCTQNIPDFPDCVPRLKFSCME
jgi:hypothetical protein